MTRCSVDGWWPFCIRFDEPPRYSENDLSGIIEAVGRLPDGDIEYHSHYEDAVGWITISMPRREGLAKMLENAAEAISSTNVTAKSRRLSSLKRS